MSQPLQLSGLNALLGQGGKGKLDSEQLGEMLQAMELDGKSFSDLLDSEFAQFLDQEQLQNLQDNPVLLEGLRDEILPLLALLGGRDLPLQQGADGRLTLADLEADDALMQKLQTLLGNEKNAQALKNGELSLDDLVRMMPMDKGDDAESSEDFLKQIQMLTGKTQKIMTMNQQAVQQSGVEPLVNSLGLTTAQNAMQQNLPPIPVSQTIQTPPGQPGWDAQVGQRLIFMVSNEMKAAEIRLNPAELGPMEVKVKTEGEKVSLVINVQNPQVREAVEQSLPRLREMFAGQGMDLGNVDVGQHGFAQRDQDAPEQRDHYASGYGQGNEIEEVEREDVVSTSEGMVDYYI